MKSMKNFTDTLQLHKSSYSFSRDNYSIGEEGGGSSMSTYRRRLLFIHENHFIKFEDPNVEACLKYFDTDNNGRISFDDLAKVDSRMLYQAFHELNRDARVKVVKFNEFKYFVGIDETPYGLFNSFYNLEEIELPAVKHLGGATFAYIYKNKIKKIIIPEGIKTIGQICFLGALAPNITIRIPSTVEKIGVDAFSWLKDVTFIFNRAVPPEIEDGGIYWKHISENKRVVGYAPDESVALYKNSPIVGKICSDILPISQYKGS